MVWHSKLRPFKPGERHAAGIGGNLFAPALLEGHLAKLRERQAAVGGPRAYWRMQQKRERHLADKERRKELNALLKLIKESEPFWE